MHIPSAHVPPLPVPRLATTPYGALRSVRQLSLLRKIAEYNRKGVRPTRYQVGKTAMPGGRGTRGYPYEAITKLINYGLVRDVTHAESKHHGSQLEVTESGKREIQYWNANPILAREGRLSA